MPYQLRFSYFTGKNNINFDALLKFNNKCFLIYMISYQKK